MPRPLGKRLSILLLLTVVVLLQSGCSLLPPQEPTYVWLDQTEAIEDLWQRMDLAGQLEHIRYLSSDELEGRLTGSDGEEKAATYLVDHLLSYGLEPWTALGLSDYRHAFAARLRTGEDVIGNNVIAVLPGELSDSFLLVGAHYDHLGIREGNIYNGTDDNAVAVGAVLEIARVVSESRLTPKHTMVFVLFSGEEHGLWGSKALVELLKEKRLAGNAFLLNLEMMGAVAGDFMGLYEHDKKTKVLADRIQHEIETANVSVKRFGGYPGDSLSFAEAGVPAVTCDWGGLPWGSENHPYYHHREDTFDKLNHDIVARGTRAMVRVAWVLANR